MKDTVVCDNSLLSPIQSQVWVSQCSGTRSVITHVTYYFLLLTYKGRWPVSQKALICLLTVSAHRWYPEDPPNLRGVGWVCIIHSLFQLFAVTCTLENWMIYLIIWQQSLWLCSGWGPIASGSRDSRAQYYGKHALSPTAATNSSSWTPSIWDCLASVSFLANLL